MTSRVNILSNGKPSSSSNVCYTLPITCQICLGKVKDPTVCPNLHAFCSACIDIWLDKTKQCPTCRIQIDKENPCKKILGGIENSDDVDLIKPTEFSHAASRKARYLNLFQEYEDEIARLNNYIDSLNDELTKLKNSNDNCSKINTSAQEYELIQSLNNKIQNLQKNHDEMTKEREELKEQNRKLDSENSILIQDIARLKASLNEKNSQITSKYTVAALESKIEGYEKEIKQLQKALEKSDKYIADLELKREIKDKENKINRNSAEEGCNSNNTLGNNSKNEILNLNSDLKNFKCPAASLTSPPSSFNSPAKKNIISKDNFYGSPSKTPNIINPSTSANTAPSVSSFGDRLKKNLFNAPSSSNGILSSNVDFEAPGRIYQNLINNNQSVNMMVSNTSNNFSIQSNPNAQNFLFSPMKRLRLEEDHQNQYQTNRSVSSIGNQCEATNFITILNNDKPNINEMPSLSIVNDERVYSHVSNFFSSN